MAHVDTMEWTRNDDILLDQVLESAVALATNADKQLVPAYMMINEEIHTADNIVVPNNLNNTLTHGLKVSVALRSNEVQFTARVQPPTAHVIHT